jgi:SAM-dependent methyltransferase
VTCIVAADRWLWFPKSGEVLPGRCSRQISAVNICPSIKIFATGGDCKTSIMSSSTRDASGWSASLYNTHVSFVYSPAFTSPILELLAAQPGERIIDFGCGSGEVTLELKKRVEKAPGGVVVGVDFSESMVRWMMTEMI